MGILFAMLPSISSELSSLFQRDLARLRQEVEAFGEDQALWKTLGGVSNCAGNLALHLEGNLREYIGRQLGGVNYIRTRDLEFSENGVPVAELLNRLSDLNLLIPEVIARLSDSVMNTDFPENVLGVPLSTRQFLMHLLGHLNYHVGQIDYLRRILTGQRALVFARL